MTNLEFAKLERISMKQHPHFNEKWLQMRIADDPGLLGLGDVVVKDIERRQPRAGRLDLLLQDSESDQRYEVEIQLGSTDESHIIRTIEYWDIERKRYPQYDHTAVIIAEDITSRFLNVLGLFNGMIPLIAIQASAVQLDDKVSLLFTKVLDQMTLGLDDDDDDSGTSADRAYWEKRSTPNIMRFTDQVFEVVRDIDSELKMKYNKFYIVPAIQGLPSSFVTLQPKKKFVRVSIRLPRSEEREAAIEAAGMDLLEFSKQGRYKIRLWPDKFEQQAGLLKELITDAHEAYGS